MTHTMSQITLSPSQIQFSAQDNETILSAAIRQGYNLPHSCQSGVCGCCTAKLLSGDVRASGEYEHYALTPEQIQAGMILLCCSQAQNDITLDMPAYAGTHALPIRTLPARINNISLRDTIAIIDVALPKAPPFIFYAGQYMDFLLPDGSSRSYSIANAPETSTSTLEFHIRLHEGGLFSSQLFSGSLKAGSIIRLRGPLGSFSLNKESNKPLIFLATGTGFAPIKSLLQHLAHTQPKRHVHIYHGVRFVNEFYDETALHELLTHLPNSRYTPVVSRPDTSWVHATGYITEQVMHDYSNLQDFEVYACGSPAMIHSSQKILTEQKLLPQNAFFSDAFTAHI